MPIENINSVQPIVKNSIEEVKQEEEVKTAPQQKGSSKDVLAVLASLAAVGAAGVAIYKHKNAKKAVDEAVQKAEQEAKKKIEAAEEKAKKTAEEVDKKIQEAVDKAKEELKGGKTSKSESGTSTPTGSKQKGKRTKRSGNGSVGGGYSGKGSRTKSGGSGTTHGKPGAAPTGAPSPTGAPKPPVTPTSTGAPAPSGTTVPTGGATPPVTPAPKPPVTPAPTGTAEPQVAEDKPSMWTRFKGIFKRKGKAEKPADETPAVTSAEPPKTATTGSTASTEAPKPPVTPAPTGTAEPPVAEDKPSMWTKFKGIFKRKGKAEKPADETPAVTSAEPPKAEPPKTATTGSTASTEAPKPPVTPAPTGTAELPVAEDKPSMWTRFKGIFKRKGKAEKPADEAPAVTSAEPPKVEPPKTPATGSATPTGTPKPPVTPAPTGVPTPSGTATPSGTPKPLEDLPESPIEPLTPSPIAEDKPSIWAKFKGIFKRKEKAVETTAENEPLKIFKQDKNRTPKVLEGGILDTELTVKDGQYIKNLREGQNGIIFVPKEPPKFIQKIQNLFRRKAKPAEAPKVIDDVPKVEIDDVPKVEIDDLPELKVYTYDYLKKTDVTKMSESQLLSDYNVLIDVVKKLPAADPASKRFLEIQGELFNHRGYRFKNGIPVKKEDLFPKPKQPSELFKGVKMPDVRTISDENLIAEYNALKNIVKDLPAADPTSKRFMEVQGELFNHRGYRFQNGTPVKKETIKTEVRQSEAAVESETEQKLSDIFKGVKMPDVKTISDENLIKEFNALKDVVKNLPSSDPTAQRFYSVRKELFERKGYKFQDALPAKVGQQAGKTAEAEVNKAPEVVSKTADEVKPAAKPEAKIEPNAETTVPKAEPKAKEVKPEAPKPAAKTTTSMVDRTMPEFQGLSEEDALQLEYANCKYCAEKLYKFFESKQEPYKARMAEIEAELKKMGRKVDEKVGGIRLTLANQRSYFADNKAWFEIKQKELSDATKAYMNAGGGKLQFMTDEEKKLQGRYLYYKREANSMDFFKPNLQKAIKALEEKGYKPFEPVTETDKLYANYLETFSDNETAKYLFESSEKNLKELETKLAEVR